MDAQIIYGQFGSRSKILPFRKGLLFDIGSLRFVRLPVGTFVGHIKDGSVSSVSFRLGIKRAPFEELVGAISLFRRKPRLQSISLFYNKQYNVFYLATLRSNDEDITVCNFVKNRPMSVETGLYVQLENLEENCPDITLWAGIEGVFSRVLNIFALFSPEPRDAA